MTFSAGALGGAGFTANEASFVFVLFFFKSLSLVIPASLGMQLSEVQSCSSVCCLLHDSGSLKHRSCYALLGFAGQRLDLKTIYINNSYMSYLAT